MGQREAVDRSVINRWVLACLVLFFIMGLGLGTWLSRLPSLRDEMQASTLQMSVYGLCLAGGSLAGMLISGKAIERVGNRPMMAVTIVVQALALPGAVALLVAGQVPLGLVVLFVYGFTFSSTDIAMNVSGANAERALGRPRLPLMHAFYSIGSVTALGIGAAAEVMRVSLQAHYMAIAAVLVVLGLFVLRMVPKDELALRGDSPADPASRALDNSGAVPVVESATGDTLATVTGSIPVIAQPDAAAVPLSSNGDHGNRYSPWRDKRVLMIGTITLSAGFIEGAASDWLPLALVDGRDVTNEFGAIMLGLFFGAVVVARLLGSALLVRFGRTLVLRTSLVLGAVGILTISLVPGVPAMIIGTIAWGLGAGVCWPITISAAADDPKTAVQAVATVSAIGYAAMLLGPMLFGFIGEHIGLLSSFLLLPLFSLLALLLASVTKQREGAAGVS